MNEKSKSYSYSKNINKNNINNTENLNNIKKKIIKSPQSSTNKKNIINIIIKPKINYTTLNKTHIFSPINERQKSPIEYYKENTNHYKKKSKKIDDMKNIFSNNKYNIQITNDAIIEKELFKEGNKKKNKRNNSFTLRFNKTMISHKSNINKIFINQNQKTRKPSPLNNIKKIKYVQY